MQTHRWWELYDRLGLIMDESCNVADAALYPLERLAERFDYLDKRLTALENATKNAV